MITVSFVTLGHFSKIGFLQLGFCQLSKRSHQVHNHLNLLYQGLQTLKPQTLNLSEPSFEEIQPVYKVLSSYLFSVFLVVFKICNLNISSY